MRCSADAVMLRSEQMRAAKEKHMISVWDGQATQRPPWHMSTPTHTHTGSSGGDGKQTLFLL